MRSVGSILLIGCVLLVGYFVAGPADAQDPAGRLRANQWRRKQRAGRDQELPTSELAHACLLPKEFTDECTPLVNFLGRAVEEVGQ